MHVFAVVSWLKEHHARSSYVKPFEIIMVERSL
jgi:hypothetical protein